MKLSSFAGLLLAGALLIGGPTTSAYAADGTFQCTVPYAPIQASPSGYVIGNCPQGTHIRRRAKSGLVGVGQGMTDTYEGGYIEGAFQGCGWVRSGHSQALNTTTVWSNCDPDSIGYRPDEFIYKLPNGALWTDGCAGTDACSGTPVVNPHACYAAANVRPWLSGQAIPGALRFIPAGATLADGQGRFAFRYVASYPTTDGTYWAMGKDRAIGGGDGNWVFVNYACLVP
jgi:hypothetical protein